MKKNRRREICSTVGKRHRQLRLETLGQRRMLASDMMNVANPLDVNNDYSITAGDALIVVNYMNRMQVAEGESAPAGNDLFPDTNGDGQVSPGDAMRVINRLAAEGEIDLSEGDMSVTANGRDVIIKFSGNNVTLNVSTPTSGMLRLALDGGEQRDVPIEDDFIVDVTGSNLQLNLNGAVIPDDLKIEMSGGNNGFTMQNSTVGDDLLFNGGSGIDSVTLGTDAVVADLVKIRVREGNDTVSIGGARIGDDFLYYGDDGQDTLSVNGAVIGDDAVIRMGDDDDQLSMQNAQVNDVADVDGGDSSFDVISLDVATITARRFKPRDFEINRPIENGATGGNGTEAS